MKHTSTQQNQLTKSVQFFKLTADRVKQDYLEGGITAEYYILYLIDIHSFNNIGWTLDVADATSKWGIPRRTYYRAIEKLKSSGKIKIRGTKTRITHVKGDSATDGKTHTKNKVKQHYRRFLKSDYWKKVRQQVLSRDGFTCRQCESVNDLQVHHLTYKNHHRERQHLDDLITLCRSCHSKLHGY